MDIPTLNAPTVTPTQQPDAYNTLRPTAADFGGIAAEGIAKSGEILNQYAMFQKQKADALAVTDASNQLSDKLNTIMSDPTTGLLNMRGKDALKVPQLFQQQYEQAMSGIADKLTNTSQRVAFTQMAAGERHWTQMRIDNHIANEMEQYGHQTYATAISNAQSLAIKANGDPSVIAGAVSQIHGLVLAQAKSEGWSPETTDYMMTTAQSALHEGVIENMLTAGHTQQAQLYYNHVKDSITGQAQDKIQQELKVSTIATQATIQSNQIISAHPGDLAAQEDAARKIDDPSIQQEVIRQITQHDEILNRAKEDQHRNDLDTANQIINSGKGYNSIPPAIQARFTPSEVDAYHKLDNMLKSGIEPAQNWSKWTDFMNKVATDPAAVSKMNLMTEMRPYVDNAHYNQAVNLQSAAAAATGGDKTKLTSLMSPMDKFNATVFPVAFPNEKSPSSLTGQDKAQYGRLMSEVQSAVTAQESSLGRKLTPQELQKTMDDFVHEQIFVHHTFWPDSQVSRAQITADNEGDAYIPLAKIPAQNVENIRNYLRSMGTNPTDDAVQKIYAAVILGDDARIQSIAKGE